MIALNQKQNRFLITMSFLIYLIAGTCFSGGVSTLPLIRILIAYHQKAGLSKKLIAGLIPFVLLSACFFYLTIHSAHNSNIIANPYFTINQYSLIDRINLSVISASHYIYQFIFPYTFAIEYPQGYFLPLANIWATVAFISIPVLLLLNREHFFKTTHFVFGFFFFLVTIAPFLKIYSTSTSITNDRYAYLASFGLCLICAEIIDIILKKGKKNSVLTKTILISGLCYLILATWTISFNWRNGETLWSNLIRTYPKAHPFYLGRADYYMKTGQGNKALMINPRYENSLSLKDTIRLGMKQYEQSIETYSKLLKLNPQDASTLNKRGGAYSLLGQKHKAMVDFNQSIALDTGQASPYYNRSAIYIQNENYVSALKDLQKVIRIHPKHSLAKKKIEEVKKLLYQQ